MHSVTSVHRAMAFVLAAGLWIGTPISSVHGDTLQKPAVQSPLAAHSVLTAITRAGSRLVAVGERGHIILSDDDGDSWRQARVPVSLTLTNVRFIDAQRGWVTGHGGLILATMDGGLTWTKQLDGNGIIEAVESAGKSDPALVRTAADLKVDGPDKPFFDIHFRDSQNGIAIAAYGLVFVTRDGGTNWRPALDLVPNPDKKHLYAIRALGNEVFIAGEQGALFRSQDGGASFASIQSPYVGSFFDLLLVPGGRVLAYGLRGNLYQSMDHGQHWAKLDLGSERTLTAGVVLADGRVVLVDQAGTVWLTGDGATGFRAIHQPQSFPFAGVVAGQNGRLVAVGVRGAIRLTLGRNEISAEKRQGER